VRFDAAVVCARNDPVATVPAFEATRDNEGFARHLEGLSGL